MWIKPRGGGSDGVCYKGIRVPCLELGLDGGAHAIDELFRSRAKIGAGRIRGIVRGIDGLSGIRWIGRNCRRWTGMKIAAGNEVLANKCRTGNFAVTLDDAAVGFVWEHELRNACDR